MAVQLCPVSGLIVIPGFADGSVVARNNSILKQLVLQAKKEYEAEAVHRIQIYFADSYGSWRYTDSRHKRPLSSIVLNPGVKEMLIADAKDFLKSEKVGVYCYHSLRRLTLKTVVCGPRHPFPSGLFALRRSRLGKVIAHSRPCRRAHARYLRRLFIILLDK